MKVSDKIRGIVSAHIQFQCDTLYSGHYSNVHYVDPLVEVDRGDTVMVQYKMQLPHICSHATMFITVGLHPTKNDIKLEISAGWHSPLYSLSGWDVHSGISGDSSIRKVLRRQAHDNDLETQLLQGLSYLEQCFMENVYRLLYERRYKPFYDETVKPIADYMLSDVLPRDFVLQTVVPSDGENSYSVRLVYSTKQDVCFYVDLFDTPDHVEALFWASVPDSDNYLGELPGYAKYAVDWRILVEKISFVTHATSFYMDVDFDAVIGVAKAMYSRLMTLQQIMVSNSLGD